MNTKNSDPPHPGVYVKQNVIPNSMSVTEAAKRLGVGRPALSNFLNENSSLSFEMAVRLEQTFGIDRTKLLDIQAQFSRQTETTKPSVVTRTHSPVLTSIKAIEIEQWANQISARSELPVLIRRLIHSASHKLTFTDVPAYDNAQRHGWDGVVEAKSPTPWIPEGKSCWEFSCSQRPHSKAEQDYSARVKSIPKDERQNLTFVFVTPRNWLQKENWVSKKRKLGDWKDLRVYDASDLEQWLEDSAPTQVWFSEGLGKPVSGYRSLDQCWADWAAICEPVLTPAIFDQFVQEYSKEIRTWLANPPTRPYVVAADSREEGLAFLKCIFHGLICESAEAKSNAISFDSPEAVQRFKSAGSAPRIAVIHDPEVENSIGGLFRSCHCVIVRPSNEVNANADIQLGIVSRKNFEEALKGMSLSEARIARLDLESARSPTILRRCLSRLPEIRKPLWAASRKNLRNLLPATLVGAWDNANSSDREVVQFLANANKYDDFENGVSELLALEDSPLWSEGQYRGVKSRTDSLFSIANFVTEQDLKNFFFVAEFVLSERDPAIDLPVDKQWAAILYEKVRNHSEALRHGIRETLILFAVFGGDRFNQRLGFDIKYQVDALIRKLLTPLNTEKILSQKSDLPEYAEAAPEVILNLIEIDLKKDDPILQSLINPTSIDSFNGPDRTHLLWALECLAWHPTYFPRVVAVLAKLCEIEGEDRSDSWSNTSVNTLKSLFRSWWPMTNASLDERTTAFKTLCCKYPSIGWNLCLSQIDWRRSAASMNYRMRWRENAEISYQPDDYEEHREFETIVIEMILNWPNHELNTLIDLVKKLDRISDDRKIAIWNLVDQWIDSNPCEDEKADLHRHIQAYVKFCRQKDGKVMNIKRVNMILNKLLSNDLVIRSVWLFESSWIDVTTKNLNSQNFDFKKNDEQLRKLRTEALQTIWLERGFEGMEQLMNRVNKTTEIIGELMPTIMENNEDLSRFAEPCLDLTTIEQKHGHKACLAGFLRSVDSDFVKSFVESIKGNDDKMLTALLCMPYRKSTWDYLAENKKSLHDAYWKNVEPNLWPDSSSTDDINLSLDKLLEVGRVDAAFSSIYMLWDKVETSRLVELLRKLIQSNVENSSRIIGNGYNISHAFEELNNRTSVSDYEKAELEFAFFEVLEYSDYGIPNLERLVTESPELFVHAIRCLYKRADGSLEEHFELGFSTLEEYRRAASNWFRFFYREHRIPGTNDMGEIDTRVLKDWLHQARALLRQHDRVEIGDQMIGQMLASSPVDSDGVWPCLKICEALESIASEQIGTGLDVGKRNLRGAQMRREGGNQERKLAAQYHRWSHERIYEFPFVGKVLKHIAEAYEHEATWWDNETKKMERLHFH